jgi:hypothetical protein
MHHALAQSATARDRLVQLSAGILNTGSVGSGRIYGHRDDHDIENCAICMARPKRPELFLHLSI